MGRKRSQSGNLRQRSGFREASAWECNTRVD
jgi:hypothetical protein